MNKNKPRIFREYTVEQLRELTGYSLTYLRDLRARPARCTPHFRKYVSMCLKRPERELFETSLFLPLGNEKE